MVTHDKDIIVTLKESAEAGFRLLMAKYKEAVYWHIRRLVVSHDDAQDASQETFVRIFRSFHQFKEDAPLSVWIYRIATNEALRIIGRRRRNTSLDEPGVSAHDMMADEYLDYSDVEAIKLQKAIMALPTKQQIAFNLRYYDDLGYEEIAQIINSKAASVKANYHIAKEKIIKYMDIMD